MVLICTIYICDICPIEETALIASWYSPFKPLILFPNITVFGNLFVHESFNHESESLRGWQYPPSPVSTPPSLCSIYSPNLSIYFQGYTFQQIPDKNKIFFKMWQSRIIKKIIEILYFRQIYSVLDYAGCLLFSGLWFAKPNLISCFLSKKTLTTQFHICPLFRFCWQNYTRYFVHVI